MLDSILPVLVKYFINLSFWDSLNSFLIGTGLVIFSIYFGRSIKDLSQLADMTFKIWPFKRRINPAYVFGEIIFRLGCGLMMYSVAIIVILLLKLLFPM